MCRYVWYMICGKGKFYSRSLNKERLRDTVNMNFCVKMHHQNKPKNPIWSEFRRGRRGEEAKSSHRQAPKAPKATILGILDGVRPGERDVLKDRMVDAWFRCYSCFARFGHEHIFLFPFRVHCLKRHTYLVGSPTSIWFIRDWVIRASTENLPELRGGQYWNSWAKRHAQ